MHEEFSPIYASRLSPRPPQPRFIPYEPMPVGDPPEVAARRFYETIRRRRSIRTFSDQPVSRETIEWIVRAAGSAPSGANKQPWRFVCINDPALKREIRLAAEAEEREFYLRRASERWLRDLWPLGTDEHKPFLETAPWLIAVFKLVRDDPNPATPENPGQLYYTEESVGIATGMLITAIHLSGLVTLTHTPSPMQFLARTLQRPPHERPFLLLPVGHPATPCQTPDIQRKSLPELMVVNLGKP